MGTHVGQGPIRFVPSGVDTTKKVVGVDYYDKIKQVIDRVRERRNPNETNAANAYEKAIQDMEERDGCSKKNERTYPLRRTTNIDTGETSLDVQWKEERVLYPKASSRLGDEYQVGPLPTASSRNMTSNM